LEREIVSAVAVESEDFNRARYGHLWQQWYALAPDLEAELATLTDQLDAEWNWLRDHPDHAEHDAARERWTARLRAYDQVFRDFERSMT